MRKLVAAVVLAMVIFAGSGVAFGPTPVSAAPPDPCGCPSAQAFVQFGHHHAAQGDINAQVDHSAFAKNCPETIPGTCPGVGIVAIAV